MNLFDLDTPQVWNIDLACSHLQSKGITDRERCLIELGLMPASLKSENLLDEFKRSPIAAVLNWSIAKAKSDQYLVIFIQLIDLPNGSSCLYANDDRGNRFWVPIITKPATISSISSALTQLQIHIGKPVAIFPHGSLTGLLRKTPTPQNVSIDLLSYQPLRDLEAQIRHASTLALSTQIDALRGEILSQVQNSQDLSDQFEATLLWINETAGLIGRTYDLQLGTQTTPVLITSIKYRLNENTQSLPSNKQLNQNDICVCKLSTNKQLPFDIFARTPDTKPFTLVDRLTHTTVAAGIIRHSLSAGNNVTRHAHKISRIDREHLNGHKGKIFWFTGYSGSGKSTLANAFETAIHAQGFRTFILDGDNVRHGLNKDLTFTDADRVENIRRVAEVAKLMVDAGLIVITTLISPFREERNFARSLFEPGQFIEVFVDTPLELCEQRDPKGLYKKARSGLIPNMTGINSHYDPADNAEIIIKTEKSSLEEEVEQLKAALINGLN